MRKAPIQGRSAPAFWERRGITSWLLWPLSKLFGLFVASKNALHDLGIGIGKPFSVPIIIVGNLRVGGTGKTPIVIALAEQGDAAVLPFADEVIPIPLASTFMEPLLAVVPLHIFGMELAAAKGLDIDQPRNLAKSVTVE